MYVGAGGVQAELDPQLPALLGCFGEFPGQFGLGEDLNRAAF
jgi:hypothetical protein